MPLSSTGLLARSEARLATVPTSSKARAWAASLRSIRRRCVAESFQSTSIEARLASAASMRPGTANLPVSLIATSGNVFPSEVASLNFTSWMTFQSLSWMKKKFVTWPFRVRTINISLLL